ncbi:MAG TPA: HAD-IIB family hydrolase [Nitrospirae bacterium]|nr:HAD-IIB family hydrolase [Nitrospirota bacterium]
MDNKLIIFTDLDGSLLDSNYSFEKAKPALKLINKRDIPLVICSSKTMAEIEYLRGRLKNYHPFISENGGGVFIPDNYFIHQAGTRYAGTLKKKEYQIIRLGSEYNDLRTSFVKMRSMGFDIKGFADMSVKEVSQLTGLKMSDAKRAKQRDFDEPFTFRGSPYGLRKLKHAIKSEGLTHTIGHHHHLMGESDKGRAVDILSRQFRRQYKNIITVALGDSPNDIEMFDKVDHAVIIQKPDGSYDKRIKMKKLIKADGPGPEGWNRAVLKILDNYNK